MGQRHSGHPLSNAATASAHAPQKRECPHGTSATAEHGCSRQTSQVSVAAFSYSGGDDVGASSCSVSSSVSLALAIVSSSRSTSVCATEWLIARRNSIREYTPSSYLRMHISTRRSFCSSLFRLLPNSATNCCRFRRLQSPVWTGLKDVFGGKR